MSSVRIYQTNPYCKDTVCEVINVLQKNNKDVVVTDKSVFFPEGGGQPSDTGTITLNGIVYEVTYAYDNSLEDDVYHETSAPAGTFKAGDKVELAINWDSRYVNMQRHCGEHMLSGAFYNLYGGVNKGFHMGADYIAIDIDLNGRILTSEEIASAEDSVNEAIRNNLPVEVRFFDSYEASKIMPVRKDVPHDGKVSVVTIGDTAAPYDCIACCGTHPATTSEVGLVAVYKSEPNKGMTRIYFDCGRLAIEKLKHDYATLTSIANSLSTSNDGVPHKLEIQAQREADFKGRLALLSTYYKDKEQASMTAAIKEKRSNGSRVHSFDNDILDVNDLLKLGFAMCDSLEDDELLTLRDIPSHTVLLLSKGKDIKCGDIAKNIAPPFDGRGGGRPDNARVAFKSAEDAKAFIEHLSK